MSKGAKKKGRWEVEVRYMEPQPDGSYREDTAKRKIFEVNEKQKDKILKLVAST